MAKPTAIIALKKRPEFLAVAAHGKKWVTPGFIVQMAPRPSADPQNPSQTPQDTLCGLGLTASKKMVGIAVARNRARRRLKALARDVLAVQGKGGMNYVLIAREASLGRDFQALRKDLEWALRKLAPEAEKP